MTLIGHHARLTASSSAGNRASWKTSSSLPASVSAEWLSLSPFATGTESLAPVMLRNARLRREEGCWRLVITGPIRIPALSYRGPERFVSLLQQTVNRRHTTMAPNGEYVSLYAMCFEL